MLPSVVYFKPGNVSSYALFIRPSDTMHQDKFITWPVCHITPVANQAIGPISVTKIDNKHIYNCPSICTLHTPIHSIYNNIQKPPLVQTRNTDFKIIQKDSGLIAIILQPKEAPLV